MNLGFDMRLVIAYNFKWRAATVPVHERAAVVFVTLPFEILSGTAYRSTVSLLSFAYIGQRCGVVLRCPLLHGWLFRTVKRNIGWIGMLVDFPPQMSDGGIEAGRWKDRLVHFHGSDLVITTPTGLTD